MSDTTTTPYSNRCEILADLWTNYRTDEEFVDFVEYNDLGLPLAYAVSTEIVQNNPLVEAFINETWDLFLAALKVEDTGFESVEEVLDLATDKEQNRVMDKVTWSISRDRIESALGKLTDEQFARLAEVIVEDSEQNWYNSLLVWLLEHDNFQDIINPTSKD